MLKSVIYLCKGLNTYADCIGYSYSYRPIMGLQIFFKRLKSRRQFAMIVGLYRIIHTAKLSYYYLLSDLLSYV